MASTSVVYNLIARDRASSVFGKVAKQAETASQKVERAGKSMMSAGKGLTAGVTTPIVGVGVAAVKMGMDYETSMLKVKSITGATGKNYRRLQDQAQKLGATTQFSAGQAADAMTFLGMAGFKTNDIIKAMPGTLDLAAASGMDLATTADIMSNVLTGFGKKTSEAGKVSDLMAKAVTSANTDMQQLGDAMKYVAPVAAASGLSIEETTAAIGGLSNAGIQGTMAGTALRGAITRLSKPTKQAQKALDKLGINAIKSNGKMKPLHNIIGQLGKSGATTADYMTIFGQRAGPGMQALVGQGVPALQKLTKGLRNSGGTAKKMADTQMSGLKGALDRLQSAAEGLAISIAESGLLDMFTKWANKIAKFVGEMSQANPKFLRMGTVIAAVAAAIGPLLIVAGMLVVAIARVGAAMKATVVATKAAALWIGKKFRAACIGTRIQLAALKVQTIAVAVAQKAMKVGAMAAAVGQRVLNAAMRANPIGLIITAIAGLVAALVWVFTKTKWGKKVWSNVWGGIKAVSRVVWAFIKLKVLEPLRVFFTEKVPAALRITGKFFSSVWGGIKSITNTTWKWVKKWVISPVIDFFTEKIPTALRLFRVGARVQWDKAKSIMDTTWKWIKRWIVNPVIDFFKETIPGAFRKFRSVAGDVWEKLKSAIGGPFKWIKKNVLNPLIRFVKETIPDSFDKGVAAVKRIWGKIQGIAKKPIKFVVETVLNKGLIKAFNSVTDFLKLDGLHIDPIRLPQGFRKGGRAKGWAMVGEEGPELVNFTNPGRVYTAKQTGAALKHTEDKHALGAPMPGSESHIWGPVQRAAKRTGVMEFLSLGNTPGFPMNLLSRAAGVWNGLAGITTQAMKFSRSEFGSNSVGTFWGGMPRPGVIGYYSGQSVAIKRGGPNPLATLVHEIGHALGLGHNRGNYSVMNPVLGRGGGALWPTRYDALNLRRIYGAPSAGSKMTLPPKDGGGGWFDPVGWVVDKITAAVKGLIEKIPGAGAVLDLATGAAKKLFEIGKKWVINTAKDIMGAGHAGGTRSASPGWRWVGERGPELVRFHGGERVKSHRDSVRYAAGQSNSDRPIQVALPERMILRVGSREFEAYMDERAVIATGEALNNADTRLTFGGKHVGARL